MCVSVNGRDADSAKHHLNKHGRRPTSFSALSLWFSSFTEFTRCERSGAHTDTHSGQAVGQAKAGYSSWG